MFRDVRVLDRGGVVQGASLHPLGGHGRAGDGGPATKGLEARVGDLAGRRVDADLQLHHITAGRGAHQPGPDVGVLLVKGPDVAGALVVVDDLFGREGVVVVVVRW